MPEQRSALQSTFGLLGRVGGAALLNPLNRTTNYVANLAYPGNALIPEMGDLIDLVVKGRLEEGDLWSLAGNHGAGKDKTWQKILDASQQMPRWETWLYARYRGWIDDDTWNKLTGMYGYRDSDVFELMAAGPTEWGSEDVRRLKSLGFFDAFQWGKPGNDVYTDWLKASGLRTGVDLDAFRRLYQPPPPTSCLELRNRDEIDDDVLRQWLILNGMTDNEARTKYASLRHQIPGPSDLVTFAVREVWDKRVVDEFGYDDEFDRIPEFRRWMEMQGYGKRLENAEGQEGGPESWAQAYWRAHWTNISPTQAYNALHRLRPTDSTKPGPRVPVVPGSPNDGSKTSEVKPFTISDVNMVLKVNDYAPKFRNALAALSYNVLRLVDIRRIVELSLRDHNFQDRTIGLSREINPSESPGPELSNPTREQRIDFLRAWARENFLDRGQTPEAATALAELAIAGARRSIDLAQRRRLQRAEERLHKLNERAYATYSISRDDYVSGRMHSWKAFTTILVDEDGGPVTIPVGATHAQVFATSLSLLIDHERKQRRFEQAVRSIRQDFLDGAIDQDEVVPLLAKAGMIREGAVKVQSEWTWTMNIRHATAKTSDVLRWYNELLIDENTALRRLENLGWSHADALLELELPPPRRSARGEGGVYVPQPSSNGS